MTPMILPIINGKEHIDKIAKDISDKIKERVAQGSEVPKVVNVYANNETLHLLWYTRSKAMVRDCIVRTFTYDIDSSTRLHFVPCECIPFGFIDYSFF